MTDAFIAQLIMKHYRPATPADGLATCDSCGAYNPGMFRGIELPTACRCRECATVEAKAEAWDTANDEEMDCTDFAHPAWWRGSDYGVAGACERVNEFLDGKLAGSMREPMQSLKDRIAGHRQLMMDTCMAMMMAKSQLSPPRQMIFQELIDRLRVAIGHKPPESQEPEL